MLRVSIVSGQRTLLQWPLPVGSKSQIHRLLQLQLLQRKQKLFWWCSWLLIFLGMVLVPLPQQDPHVVVVVVVAAAAAAAAY